mmetsp:Transcript_50624/g.134818  ORF Transcript_50624/g.134818 Transcript_50624/m.134818 type:complete len:98 (+) Transcript_50624:4034-4327(+)
MPKAQCSTECVAQQKPVWFPMDKPWRVAATGLQCQNWSMTPWWNNQVEELNFRSRVRCCQRLRTQQVDACLMDWRFARKQGAENTCRKHQSSRLFET